MDNKHENRTFETRLLFIKDIFSHKYEPEKILTSSIKHKLKETFEQYEQDLSQSVIDIKYENNPVKILKKLNKETK